MKILNQKNVVIPVAAASLIIIAACLAAGFILQNQHTEEAIKEQKRTEYASDNTLTVEMGETITLNSEEDALGTESGFVANLGWSGVIEATLTDVVIYDSMEKAGISTDNAFYSETADRGGGNWMFVLCGLNLKNKDAVPTPEVGHFNISSFGLAISDASSDFWPPDTKRPVEYFDGSIPGANEKDLYLFSLEKNEERDFKLGFFVQEEDLYHESAICIGINPDPLASKKYQIRFSITPDMVKES